MRSTYQNEIAQAWKRVRAVPTRTLSSSYGRVEYAMAGSGQPVLMSHGILGSHTEALGMVSTYFGEALAIAPSRFGYFRSEMPRDASPARQADVYAELLDEVGVERCVAIGFSAGGPSAIEFALRHPDRMDLLVLASAALPREPIPVVVTKVVPPVMRLTLSRDRPFWLFKTLMPRTCRHLLGVPESYEATGAAAATLQEITSSVFPIRPRREGAVFDAFIGNPHVNTSPLEDINVPTLIIHAADDALAPYTYAQDAAARIPNARLVTVATGGHEFLGSEPVVRDAIHGYLDELRAFRSTPTRIEALDEQQLVRS